MSSIDPADVLAQIEQDFSWRWDEMRLLKNQLIFVEKEEDRMRCRKALVVMLYSHYEGFCKVAFTTYIGAINSQNLECHEVNDAIAAAALHQVFVDFDSGGRKSDIFRNTLPEDTSVRKLARQIEFLGSMRDVWKREVVIPDDIVNTEQNLKPIVLRKILYRLGFSHEAIKDHESDIHFLLNRRNGVAHGAKNNGIEEENYAKLEKATYRVIQAVIRLITNSLRTGDYMRHT